MTTKFLLALQFCNPCTKCLNSILFFSTSCASGSSPASCGRSICRPDRRRRPPAASSGPEPSLRGLRIKPQHRSRSARKRSRYAQYLTQKNCHFEIAIFVCLNIDPYSTSLRCSRQCLQTVNNLGDPSTPICHQRKSVSSKKNTQFL